MTSFTPGRVMSATEVMWAGLPLGTIITSVLVANSTGFSIRPLASSAAGCLGLAAANTSAGAPASISVSSAPDPPNVYFAFGSISGNTFVSDAAANTVGTGASLLEEVELAAALELAGRDDAELDPPLPQAASTGTSTPS